MVQRELNAIVSSHHFWNSKRYPALLKYGVDKTLDGHADQLKERTLGVEVFDRPPDYDTNADPVVRFITGSKTTGPQAIDHFAPCDSTLGWSLVSPSEVRSCRMDRAWLSGEATGVVCSISATL